jgi:Protein of unknown function (DUF1552)
MMSRSRRAFLGGAAVTVGLPALESLHWKRYARAAVGPAPKRLLVVHVPNGAYMKAWMPVGTGPNFTLSETLMPLSAVKSDVQIVTGMVNSPGTPPVFDGSHAGGCGALLTCTQVTRPDIRNTKSMDQILADQIGTTTRLPSLELGFKDTNACEGWPCSYHQNISWRGPSTPAPPIRSPKAALDRVFAGFDAQSSLADAKRREVLRTSVLDVVLDDSKRLAAKLGAADQRKLDEYYTSVREVEERARRLATTPPPTTAACKVIPVPPEDPADFPSLVALTQDLIVLAFQCDATRVITWTHGHALGFRSYSFLAGVTGDGHACTHHAGDPVKIDMTKKIDLWRIQQLAILIQKLKAATDVDGSSLLYNTCLYYTSEIGDGDPHLQSNKPILLAGQLGGSLRTGQVVEVASKDPITGKFRDCGVTNPKGCNPPGTAAGGTELASFYVSLLRAYGVSIDQFGQQNAGPLPPALQSSLFTSA